MARTNKKPETKEVLCVSQVFRDFQGDESLLEVVLLILMTN